MKVLPLTDAVLAVIEAYPDQFAPENPTYHKNPVSAPGTVRSWFRQMRAAEVAKVMGPWPLSVWTIVDTQQVVDRETAKHYKPNPVMYWFLVKHHWGGRLTEGRFERARPDVKPALKEVWRARRAFLGAELEQVLIDEMGGQPFWDSTDYTRDVTWLGLDRSRLPLRKPRVYFLAGVWHCGDGVDRTRGTTASEAIDRFFHRGAPATERR